MRLILATDTLDEVRWAEARGLCDGVLLPDDALTSAADAGAASGWLRDFCRAVPGPVFVAPPVGPDADPDALGRAARDAVRTVDGALVQLPFRDETAPVVRALAAEGVRVAATFVGSAVQALLAAKAGAAAVLLDVDRLAAAGLDAAVIVRDARVLRDTASLEADLIALFPAGAGALPRIAEAGADAAVVAAPTLRAWLAYPLTDAASGAGSRRPTAGRRLRADGA